MSTSLESTRQTINASIAKADDKEPTFASTVVRYMRHLYPENLADKSFDNTGLLLEAVTLPGKSEKTLALLTIDLTRAVVQEAIEKSAAVVISYHPPIFKPPLKSLTLANPKQSSLLSLAAHGIQVYSPHTAIDARVNGNADLLVKHIEKGVQKYLASGERRKSPAIKVIQPSKEIRDPEDGFGRTLEFERLIPLTAILSILKKLFDVDYLPVAIPQSVDNIASVQVKSVAVCAGAGSGVLRDADADLLITGEYSHHDTLAAIESGKCVVHAFHSNSERWYLKQMKAELEDLLQHGLNRDVEGSTEWKPTSKVEGKIEISERDRDPYQIWSPPKDPAD
ncbi:MAG: hypothetical protein M1814_001326 [Vezdaea aestivalis]|nr:MAG: hypothetical protein M1814_001326 [Vezdaea aestivalis]